MKRIELFATVLLSAILVHAQDQTPEILSVSHVVAGPRKPKPCLPIPLVNGRMRTTTWQYGPPKLTVMSVSAFARKLTLRTTADKPGRLSTVSIFSAGTNGN